MQNEMLWDGMLTINSFFKQADIRNLLDPTEDLTLT